MTRVKTRLLAEAGDALGRGHGSVVDGILKADQNRYVLQVPRTWGPVGLQGIAPASAPRWSEACAERGRSFTRSVN